MRVSVVYDNRKHRFLSLARVKLKQGGADLAEVAGSVHGHRQFEVTGGAGTIVTLDFSIPTPEDAGAELMFFTQEMTVAAGAGGRLTLTPANKGRFAGDFHPRLSPQPTMVASGKGSIVTITVDLTFIDVTDRCLGLGRLAAFNKLQPQVTPPPPAQPPAQHYDVELKLLEYTKGFPVTWAALIPKTMRDNGTQKDIPVVVFYRPTGAAYTNSDNVRLDEFIRYMDDPPPASPFFAGPGGKGWIPYPNCGWLRQIAECKKAFVFLHPLPHGGSFGDLEGAAFVSLANAAVQALWADNHIGTKVASGLGRGRMIAAAFSFGGDPLFRMLKALGKDVDRIKELFLFDPNGFTDHVGLLTAWFATGGKKLRMVGGSLHQGMRKLAAALRSPDATVVPAPGDYWQADALYRSAVFFHEMSPSGGTANTFSQATGMFEKRSILNDTGIEIEGRTSLGDPIATVEVPNCSNREAASMIVAMKLKSDAEKNKKPPPAKPTPAPKLPVKTAADLNHNAKLLNDTVKFIRHQWAVCGGEDKTRRIDRQEDFVGFLQKCLEQAQI